MKTGDTIHVRMGKVSMGECVVLTTVSRGGYQAIPRLVQDADGVEYDLCASGHLSWALGESSNWRTNPVLVE